MSYSFIALVGLLTKYGIQTLEFTNQLRRQGKDRHDKPIEASALRLQPTAMTTTAIVLGALSLAYATHAGAGGSSEIGIVIAAGMTFDTLGSLFFRPIRYSMSRCHRHQADGGGMINGNAGYQSFSTGTCRLLPNEFGYVQKEADVGAKSNFEMLDRCRSFSTHEANGCV